MKKILIFWLLCLVGFSQTSGSFKQANDLYNSGYYKKAIDRYGSILASNLHSAELYYNLANCYYKLNEIGPSIFYYEKALQLSPNDSDILIRFVGELNENLKLVEKIFKVKIFHNGNKLNIKGADDNAQRASSALLDLYKQTQKNNEISNETIHLCIQEHMNQPTKKTTKLKEVKSSYQIHTPKKVITARGTNQEQYLKNIESNELNFGIGPAGTGKTYLAVALAVEGLLKHQFEKIILARPAVEAGEKLGFLPGDLSEKVNPYLQPIYSEYSFSNCFPLLPVQ